MVAGGNHLLGVCAHGVYVTVMSSLRPCNIESVVREVKRRIISLGHKKKSMLLSRSLCILLCILLIISIESFVTFPGVSWNHQRVRTDRKLLLLHETVLTPEIIYSMSNDEMVKELLDRRIEFRDCINRPQLIRRLLALVEVDNVTTKTTLPFDAQKVIEAKERAKLSDPFDENLPTDMREAVDKIGTEVLQSIAQDPKLRKIMSDPVMQEMLMKMQKYGPEAIKLHLSDPESLVALDTFRNVVQESLRKHMDSKKNS